MDFVVSLFVQTALVPIVVSTAVMLAAMRIPRISPASGAVALTIGFFVGWSMQEWTTLRPSRYLDWLPWVAVVLSAASLAIAGGLPRKLAIPITIAVCIGAAWLLVPRFPRLQPAWLIVTAVASVSLFLVAALENAAKLINVRLLTACFMATGTAGSIVLAQSFAMKFAQILGMLTAALAGSLLFSKPESQRTSVGLSLVFITVLANLMLIGYANSSSNVPAYCYAMIVIAPLSVCGVATKPHTENISTKRLIIGVTILVAILLLAVGPAIMAHPPWEAE